MIPQKPHGGLFLPQGGTRCVVLTAWRWLAFCNAACTKCIGGPGQSLSVCNRGYRGELLCAAVQGAVVACSHQTLTRLLTAQIPGWRGRVRPQSGARAV